jgi:protein-arginine kinase activator protein McsA
VITTTIRYHFGMNAPNTVRQNHILRTSMETALSFQMLRMTTTHRTQDTENTIFLCEHCTFSFYHWDKYCTGELGCFVISSDGVIFAITHDRDHKVKIQERENETGSCQAYHSKPKGDEVEVATSQSPVSKQPIR